MAGLRTSALIHEWDSGDARYRAISIGHSSREHRDNIVVERRLTDALGNHGWVEHQRWCTPLSSTYGVTDENRFWTVLVDGLASAIAERDRAAALTKKEF